MQYEIQFVYNDTKDLKTTLDEEDVARFLEAVNKSEIFWDKTETHGFWTDLQKVRYMRFFKKTDMNQESIGPEIKEVISDEAA